MVAIKNFRGGGGGNGRGRRTRAGCGFAGSALCKFLVGCALMSVLIGPRTTSAFFIDLDALGFSMSKDGQGGDVSRDDSSLSASDTKLLIATPSPYGVDNSGGQQEIVEIESKADPNKSVKLSKFIEMNAESIGFSNPLLFPAQLWPN